jgi:hypothetical protein
MNDIYYVQTQARRILKCIYPNDLSKGKICSKYLRDISEKRFWKAVAELRNIFREFYSQAEKDLASLNLPLVEINKYKNTSSEARNSNNALLNLPNALLSIGACAKFAGKTIQVEISGLKKYFSELKCKNLPEQLNLLSDYGFLFEGFDNNKLPKSGILNIDYPDNSDILTVIAAIGDKFAKYMPYYFKQPKSCFCFDLFEQFIFLTPGIFTDNTETLPLKTIEHMSAVVGKDYKDILLKIVKIFEERGLTFQFGTAFLKNSFFDKKGKETLIYIEYGDYKSVYPFINEKMILRLKLNNLDAYIDKIENLPPHLYKAFTDVWCSNCTEKCNRRIVYHLKGEEKHACGCFFFGFEVKSEKDLRLLLELYDFEQTVRVKK